MHTAARAVGRLRTPTLLSQFLTTRNCRRMSIGASVSSAEAGTSRTRPPHLDIACADTVKHFKVKHRRKSKRLVNEVLRDEVDEESNFAEEREDMGQSMPRDRSALQGSEESLRSPAEAFDWKERRRKETFKPTEESTLEFELEEEYISGSTSTTSKRPKSKAKLGMFLDDKPIFSRSPPPPIYPQDRPSPTEQAEEEFHFDPDDLPPIPKAPPVPRYKVDGVSGAQAARNYLRAQGLDGFGIRYTRYNALDWILRHSARDLGYEIVPDGYVRLSELLSFELFQSMDPRTFADFCLDDPLGRFMVATLPDIVDGQPRETWWVRTKWRQSIPGVSSTSKRILNMGRLQTVVYRAPFEEWEDIQTHGICEGPDHTIRLHQKGRALYFRNHIPRHTHLVCITIDAQTAADMGVKFFHTEDTRLVAVGKDSIIPKECIRSVVELEFNKEKLNV